MNNLNIFQTHFTNMMPQRGFLVSAQPLVTIIDIDLTFENHFILKKINGDDNTNWIFVENGPMRISPYQKTLIIESKDLESLEYLQSCDFYIIENFDYLHNKDNSYSFLDLDFKYEKIKLEKKRVDNKIIFNIQDNTWLKLDKNTPIIFTNSENINPVYDTKLYIDFGESLKKYHLNGYENFLSYIDTVFKKNNLSGKLYKTRHGLRIILNDKFRSLLDVDNLNSTIHLMKEFLMDEMFLSFYTQKNKNLINYLARLTPKLKNYKYFDSSYEEVYKNLDSLNLLAINYEKNVLPLTYDFNKVTYKNDKNSELIDNSFKLLKKLIFNYLNNDSVAVCSFIKSYDGNQENKDINEFIKYHDKWTKSYLKNALLV